VNILGNKTVVLHIWQRFNALCIKDKMCCKTLHFCCIEISLFQN